MSLLRSRAQGGGTEYQLCSQSVCSSVGLPLSWGTGGAEQSQLGPARVCGPPFDISKDTKSRGAEFGVQRGWSSVWSSLTLTYRREPGQCHPEALSRERVFQWLGGREGHTFCVCRRRLTWGGICQALQGLGLYLSNGSAFLPEGEAVEGGTV